MGVMTVEPVVTCELLTKFVDPASFCQYPPSLTTHAVNLALQFGPLRVSRSEYSEVCGKCEVLKWWCRD